MVHFIADGLAYLSLQVNEDQSMQGFYYCLQAGGLLELASEILRLQQCRVPGICQ